MIKKFEQWLWYAFLFSIPIGTRYIFNYDPATFVEWRAFSVYLTDVLLAGLFALRLRSSKKFAFGFSDWLLAGVLAVAGSSVFYAIDRNVALFQWLKLAEGAALFWYVKNYAVERFGLARTFEAILYGGLFQSLIAIGQFAAQRSLGFQFAGESVLSPVLTGIAAFIVGGEKIIRAYGTTPHPNVLAAYLFVALYAFYQYYLYERMESTRIFPRWKEIILFGTYGITLFGFFLTFSRTLIGLWFGLFLIRAPIVLATEHLRRAINIPANRRRWAGILMAGAAVIGLFLVLYWPYVVNRASISSGDEAVQLRVLYNQEAVRGSIHWFGVGIGNFVPWLMRQDIRLPLGEYQPVHNIYLLLYSEIGLIGAVIFGAFLTVLCVQWYLRTEFKKLYHLSLGLVFAGLLIAGLFDHFLLTIQTGRLLLWFMAGLIASRFSLIIKTS
ncbi:MAG TPA: hypothetical protein VG941_02385 [Candidatus Paceibacterota bacterium]|nr:hypothetical protein [Candidatus Paceibacterota bacterium]